MLAYGLPSRFSPGSLTMTALMAVSGFREGKTMIPGHLERSNGGRQVSSRHLAER